jgi:hypothetical protein
MSETTFSNPTQFETTEIKIDDQDIRGIFSSLSVFEDIYRPCITGNIVIMDSDGAAFIEEQKIEFIEPISFKFKSASGETLEFEGVLNGLRNEYIDGSMKYYTIDFTSKSVRKNEQTFVTNSYKETNPEEIVSQMVQKLGGELKTSARGKQMNYLGSRKRPVDIIKYVLTHGLTQETQATKKEDSKEEEAKGTTGFLCWETIKGYKFESIKDILDGKAGEQHIDYKTKLANRSLPMDELMKSIVQVEFKQIGDFQTKLRSGAFSSKNISFDMDTGEYKEYSYKNTSNMTEKQEKALNDIFEGKDGAQSFTRVFMKPISNQKFTNGCPIAQSLTGDQSRAYLNQNSGGQNTFSDQTGHMTLYPQFQFNAGDVLDCQISKVKDEKSEGGYDKKHSGKYILQSVAHHFFNEGKAYTKVKTIRSTTQQDEVSAAKP